MILSNIKLIPYIVLSSIRCLGTPYIPKMFNSIESLPVNALLTLNNNNYNTFRVIPCVQLMHGFKENLQWKTSFCNGCK